MNLRKTDIVRSGNMAQQSQKIATHFFKEAFFSFAAMRNAGRCAIILAMTNALKQAMDQVATLPVAAQERIGQELLFHVEKIRRLRSHLERAANSLDHGSGRELDIAEVIQRARAQYGQA